MNINEFIDQITLGELSNLYIGLDGQTEISDVNRRKIINYVNQGLKSLCSKFVLQQKELIFIGSDNIALYHLRKAHSMTNGTSVLKYIDDRFCDPFNNDLIKILAVYNEIGLRFPINDHEDPNSIFTPSFDTLQMTHAVSGQGYSVIYQALHPIITYDDTGCQEFNLPPILDEALMAFVAAKAYSHMNGDANKATAQEQFGIFEMKCVEAQSGDMSAESSVASHHKAQERGFI